MACRWSRQGCIISSVRQGSVPWGTKEMACRWRNRVAPSLWCARLVGCAARVAAKSCNKCPELQHLPRWRRSCATFVPSRALEHDETTVAPQRGPRVADDPGVRGVADQLPHRRDGQPCLLHLPAISLVPRQRDGATLSHLRAWHLFGAARVAEDPGVRGAADKLGARASSREG